MTDTTPIAPRTSPRIDWVDYAKGISIILVVMMHSTLSTEEALHRIGWMHEAVAFARPFRIPAFFLIAGLFVSRAMKAEWRDFLDRKVLHFVYFYVLWLTIQVAIRAPGYAADYGAMGVVKLHLTAFIDPFGTLWFIYLLPVFYLVTRLTQRLPSALVLAAGAALEIAPIETQWTLVDEFAARFVYFYAGYLAGRWIVGSAKHIGAHVPAAVAALAAFTLVNLVCVKTGFAALPFVSLALGIAGSGAVIAVSVLLAKAGWLRALQYCGRNSLVIYLAFFLPMAVTRVALVKSGIISDAGAVATLVTLGAVVAPLILHWLVKGTALDFLFERPARFRLAPRPAPQVQAAE